jgi:hypothetical protein
MHSKNLPKWAPINTEQRFWPKTGSGILNRKGRERVEGQNKKKTQE